MARTSATKTAVEATVMEDNITETAEEMIEKKSINAVKAEPVDPLEDSDEIEIVSLISNVSYKDSRTGEMYEWDEAGHIEYMTFDILKNMWRSNKGYFRNMWLKPMDDRVINQFGLTKTFEKYELVMNASNYTKKNINVICDTISEAPNGLKFAICNKVKDLVVNGKVTDASVIRTLEKHLKIDLLEFL